MVSAELLTPDHAVLTALMAAHPRSTHWPKFRADYLVDNPRCIACGTTDALQCHHIRPFHLAPELECDPANVCTLCEAPGRWCHFRYGHLFNWRDYNPKVIEDAAAALRMLLHRKTCSGLSVSEFDASQREPRKASADWLNHDPPRRENGEAPLPLCHMYTPSVAKIAEVERNFTYHPPRHGQPERYEQIRSRARESAMALLLLCPPSRELQLALTNLEQSVFWANASIARTDHVPAEASP